MCNDGVRNISEAGLLLLKEFEGFSAQVYVCSAGKMTIGYGHVLRDGDGVSGDVITKIRAENILKQDVAVVEQAVFCHLQGRVEQAQFDALVCLVYNIGVYAFEKSTLLRFLLAGDAMGAAEQFDRWVFVGGKRLLGLVRRRQAEKKLFLS